MNPGSESVVDEFRTAPELSAETTCLPLLENSQNADGGWGFQPGHESRVEATSWALLALLQREDHEDLSDRFSRGLKFLCSAQLPDGSWPATSGQQTGSSASSLACWALFAAKDHSNAAERGLRWLCNDWPRDSAPWRRVISGVFRKNKEIVQHNDAYRGWGWTPRTASWVEPTAFAMIALSQCPAGLLPSNAAQRKQLAKALLIDRMCPGGGWNCGNPRTYGVAGEPLVVPTVWALIALREERERPEVRAGLEWLERNASEIRSGASLALTALCFETLGRRTSIRENDIRRAFEENGFLQNVCVAAWTRLAFSAKTRWLSGRTVTKV